MNNNIEFKFFLIMALFIGCIFIMLNNQDKKQMREEREIKQCFNKNKDKVNAYQICKFKVYENN